MQLRLLFLGRRHQLHALRPQFFAASVNAVVVPVVRSWIHSPRKFWRCNDYYPHRLPLVHAMQPRPVSALAKHCQRHVFALRPELFCVRLRQHRV